MNGKCLHCVTIISFIVASQNMKYKRHQSNLRRTHIMHIYTYIFIYSLTFARFTCATSSPYYFPSFPNIHRMMTFSFASANSLVTEWCTRSWLSQGCSRFNQRRTESTHVWHGDLMWIIVVLEPVDVVFEAKRNGTDAGTRGIWGKRYSSICFNVLSKLVIRLNWAKFLIFSFR